MYYINYVVDNETRTIACIDYEQAQVRASAFALAGYEVSIEYKPTKALYLGE